MTVDGFADVLVLSFYRDVSEQEQRELVGALVDVLSPRAVYLKRRPVEARRAATVEAARVAPATPVHGEPVESLEVEEHGSTFVIRPGQGLGVGLYLDARELRATVRARAGGLRVLNCFAYTCGFAVAALAGGARRAVNLDLSRRVLDWGEANLKANQLPADRPDFIAGDVFDWLGRFSKRAERFELVILDPPSFATAPRSRFSAARDYPALVARAAPVIEPGGELLACCNLSSLGRARFEAQVLQGLEMSGRTGEVVDRLGASALDFPVVPGEVSALKALLVRVC